MKYIELSTLTKKYINYSLFVLTAYLVVDGALFLVFGNEVPGNGLLEVVFFSGFSLPLLFLFRSYISKSNNEILSEDLLVELRNISISLFIFFVFNAFIQSLFNNVSSSGLVIVIISKVVGAIAIFLAYWLFSFLYRWLSSHKHKRTNRLLRIFTYSYFYYFVISFFSSNIKFLNGYLIEYLNAIIIAIIIISILMAASKNTWISYLNKRNKLKLFWMSLLWEFVGLTLIVSIWNNESALSMMMDKFISGSRYLLILSLLASLVYFFRILVSTIAALPNSDIFERRSTELNSLAYLNNLVARTFNLNEILDTVCRLALSASGGSVAWIQFIEDDKIAKIASLTNLDENVFSELDSNKELRLFTKNLSKPVIIGSLREHHLLKVINWKLIDNANSMICIPLLSNENKIGTLILLHKDEYGYENEDLKVLTAFGDNLSIALENARLLNDSIEKERYQRELLLARRMEEKLLPQHLPKVLELDLAAFSIPADEVGGDYYDMVELKNGNWCLLIGDVSGKGMSAAFYMAQLKGVVIALANESNSALELISKINNTLYGNMEKHSYITITSLEIDLSKSEFSILRAGHMPILMKKDQNIVTFKPQGIGIGLAKKKVFDKYLEICNVGFHSGDTVLLFTDGLNELKNDSNEDFGVERLKQILKSEVYTSVEDLNSIIKGELKRFIGGAKQHDDITVFSIKFN